MTPQKSKIDKIAIANRGEVAVRIIQACRELNIKTVLLYSEPDSQSRAYRMADETVCIGSAELKESYLNQDRVIQGTIKSGAQAIHPGFGFLSENAEFAQSCKDKNLIFIGPSPEAIRKMGNKTSARSIAIEVGVPVVPGYQGSEQSLSKLKEEAKKIGYPLMVKAANGGGGRGIRVISKETEFESILESAKRESLLAFGSDAVFLEKYIERAKHIEFQIFGDCTGRVFHLYDRECSIQRRHQKIIEEATSPSLTDDVRESMAQAAVRVATAVQYKGAGTVEFLYFENHFYFMEMNTRLQVEHPVTESVLGVDLVKAQILTAQEISLAWTQKKLGPRGHSIECRLYAEDPFLGGIPSTGELGTCIFPQGPGRRFDYGFESGDSITPFYDPMIGKIIVWDESREKAIEKMLQVLNETVIFGVQTNIPFLKEILNHPEFRAGAMTTQFIETYFSKPLVRPKLNEEEALAVQFILRNLQSSTSKKLADSPWTTALWRNV